MATTNEEIQVLNPELRFHLFFIFDDIVIEWLESIKKINNW